MKILGVKVDNVSLGQAFGLVEKWLQGKEQRIFTIVTPNPEIVVQAQTDRKLRKILNSSDLAVADGVGLVWASRFSKEPAEVASFSSSNSHPAPRRARGRTDSDLSISLDDKDSLIGNIDTNTIQSNNGGRPQAESALARTNADSKNVPTAGSSDLSLQKKLLPHGSSLKEAVPGVELMRQLCKLAADNGWVVGLYGGRGGAAKEALDRLKNMYPKLKGWERQAPRIDISKNKMHVHTDYTNIDKEIRWIMSKVEKTKARLLFIGLGAPKQEYFMDRIRNQESGIRNNLVLMTVGGAFDEIAGMVRSAPGLIQKLGLKWFWRLIWQPWRIRRQLRLVRFVFLVLKGRFVK